MISVRRPDRAAIDAHLASQAELVLSYEEVGATEKGPHDFPREVVERYTIDHNRERLGHGAGTFERAKDALRRWVQFDLGWVELCWPDAPLEVGQVVGVLAHGPPAFTLAACRVVYTLDEDGPIARFGLGYGTLPDHGVRGEERFSVEWRRDDDSVWYDLLAFSEPASLTARLGKSVLRRVQERFAADSKRAMKRACG